MSIFKKTVKDASKVAGTVIGNEMSRNAQNATDAAVDGMSLFRAKAAQVNNVGFEQAKGNLFEYIEAAKFNKNAAMKGSAAKAVVTDAVGQPHAAADILIQENGRTVKEIQAKFVKSVGKDGIDSSAAKSAFDQTGGLNKGGGQYHGMDRLVRKQDNYKDDHSLLEETRKIASDRAKTNNIYADEYKDVAEHLTDETNHGGVTSGGTTYEEVKQAYDSPAEYSRQFELKQVKVEMKVTAANMAKASMVTTGVISGITNMFEVFRDDKSLAEALKDVGADAVKGGIRGGTTGALSTAIRYKGIEMGSKLLSDSTAATVMAGGVIDGGVALYSYAKGEISAEQLRDELVDTTAKATTTIFYTKAVTAILGKAVSPIVPMAVYTTASYVIKCTREIIKEAQLETEEYERLTAILEESTRAAEEYRLEFEKHLAQCEENQRIMLDTFINTFDYNLETGENYDTAIYAVVSFADQAGIALQHVEFNDFKRSMKAHVTFELK